MEKTVDIGIRLSNIRLSKPGLAGGERMTNEWLTNESWGGLRQGAANVPGNGSVVQIIELDGATQPQRFYRIRRLP